MKSPLFAVLLALSAQCCPARIFEPALSPLVVNHHEEITELQKRYDAAVRSATDTYLTVLAKADETATGKGDVALLSMVTKEAETVKSGIAAYIEAGGLPPSILTVRRNFVKAVDKADLDFVTGMKKINGAYLAALGRIQPKPGTDETLSSQIAAEKHRLLTKPAAVVLDARGGMEGTTWQHVKDASGKYRFKDGTVNGTWKFSTPSANKITIHWNSSSSATYELSKNGRVLFYRGKPERVLVQDTAKAP